MANIHYSVPEKKGGSGFSAEAQSPHLRMVSGQALENKGLAVVGPAKGNLRKTGQPGR
jgi:hypothetical protein